MNWKTVYLANYNGTSEEAKSLEGLLKKNYKKHDYVPWAVMVRLLYTMDENAELEVIKTNEGDFVHTSKNSIRSRTETKSLAKDGTETQKSEESSNEHASNSVVVRCKFLGKEFVEVYPVQDLAYNAPYYYDSNMVNKSIQRAKAKVISTATGIAYRLYESGDLQFEDDVDKNTGKTTVTITPPVATSTLAVEKTTTPTQTGTGSVNNDVQDVYDLIKANPVDVLPILQMINKDTVKKFGFSLSPDDDETTLMDKISKLPSPANMKKIITTKLNLKGDK